MGNEQIEELKAKIIKRLNERYEEAAIQCKHLQEEHVAQLELAAQKQVDHRKHGGADVSSLTIREILEMERST